MKDLIELLPQVFVYFTLGYIYLHMFRYVNTIENSNDHDHIIFECLLSGYILNLLWSLIPFKKCILFNNDVVIYVAMFVGTLIIAIIAGKIFSLNLWDWFMNRIGVYRTRKSYLFDDMTDNCAVFLDLRNNETKERYFGEIFISEEYTNTPKVVLYHYKHWLNYEEEKPFENYKEDNDIAIMLDTSNFDSIIFQYEKDNNILRK